MVIFISNVIGTSGVLSVPTFVVGVPDTVLGVDCEVVGASFSVDGVFLPLSLLLRGSVDFT